MIADLAKALRLSLVVPVPVDPEDDSTAGDTLCVGCGNTWWSDETEQHIPLADGTPCPITIADEAAAAPTLGIDHDPDRGCMGCVFWQDNANRQGVCAVSGSPGRRLRTLERAVVTAPDWCRLRNGGRVVVKGPTS